MIVLGMDLSLSGTGFAVVEYKDDGTIYIHDRNTEVLDLIWVNNKGKYAKLSHGARLERIATELSTILEKYDIDLVCREKGFSRHARSTQVLYKVHGVVDYVLQKYGVVNEVEPQPAPTTIKKLITGNGKADKILVDERLAQFVGNIEYEKDDLSDATAVAVYALHHYKKLI